MSVENSTNIRDTLQSKGLDSINKLAEDIAGILDSTEELDQVDLLVLQQKMNTYSSTISMVSNLQKTLADSDDEIIRNM